MLRWLLLEIPIMESAFALSRHLVIWFMQIQDHFVSLRSAVVVDVKGLFGITIDLSMTWTGL